LGGGGGTFGTFSGGIADAEDGVLGVEEDAGPGAGLIGPSGTWVFTGACELPDPGRNAGSELKIDSLVLPDGFGASANDLCQAKSMLADGTRAEVQLEILVPGHCAEIVIPPVGLPESPQASVQGAMRCQHTRPSAA
jgi:hypothetical protein